jgi:hypothetical protein
VSTGAGVNYGASFGTGDGNNNSNPISSVFSCICCVGLIGGIVYFKYYHKGPIFPAQSGSSSESTVPDFFIGL